MIMQILETPADIYQLYLPQFSSAALKTKEDRPYIFSRICSWNSRQGECKKKIAQVKSAYTHSYKIINLVCKKP